MLFDNPFGEGKIYKTNHIGMWTFDGNIHILKKDASQIELLEKEAIAKAKSLTKEIIKPQISIPEIKNETTPKVNVSSLNEHFDVTKEDDIFIKTYDYTKVNDVLSRNSLENFKTISHVNVRKYIINWWN